MTTPVSQPASSAAQTFIQQSTYVTWWGHSFNIYAAIVLILFGLFLFALWRARKDDRIDWIDTITTTDQCTGKTQASVPKILQIVGGLTGTFCVVKMAILGSLTWDIFAVYLAYVASIDGFTRFLLAKYGVNTWVPPTSNTPPQAKN
jgi:hypothetical protein